MGNNDRFDFEMERRLYLLNPELHMRFRSAVFALQHILTNYKLIFPEYTDHSSLHSLTVIDFCNRLIGDQLDVQARQAVDLLYPHHALHRVHAAAGHETGGPEEYGADAADEVARRVLGKNGFA